MSRRAAGGLFAPDAASFFVFRRCTDWMESVLSPQALDQDGVFNPAMVQGLLRKCAACEGREMSSSDNMRLVAVVSAMALHRQFIVGAGCFSRAVSDGASIPVVRTGGDSRAVA